MSKVGFIGLSIMGRPITADLQKGSHELYLHCRSGVPEELLSAGATECSSGAVSGGEVGAKRIEQPRSSIRLAKVLVASGAIELMSTTILPGDKPSATAGSTPPSRRRCRGLSCAAPSARCGGTRDERPSERHDRLRE